MRPPSVRFVSSNPGKFREVADILRPFGLAVTWVERSLPEPQADGLGPVVAAKLAALPDDGACYLVEDSGLFIDALGGFPGVYSAYVYRTLGLAGVLRAIPPGRRAATFRTVAGIRWGREQWTAGGAVHGTIARRPRGTAGFGYDPIFLPSGTLRTFGEASRDAKDRRSHRGRAVRAVVRKMLAAAVPARPRDGRGKG